MITIKNDYLEAQFDPKGAEISKLIGMQDVYGDIVRLYFSQL